MSARRMKLKLARPKQAKPKARAKRSGRRAGPESKRGVSGGFTRNRTKTQGGTEDAEYVTLNWDYFGTLPTVLSNGSSISYNIKGNSIYRPGAVSSTGFAINTNPVGYARLYTQYRLAIVLSSRLEVTATAMTGTVASGLFTTPPLAIPIFVAANFADSTSATTYATTGNAMDLAGTPHAVSSFSLPGKGQQTLVCKGNIGVARFGLPSVPELGTIVGSGLGAASGADPGTMFYYTVTFTNNGTLNATLIQWRCRVVYQVKFYDPVACDVQVDERRMNGPSGTESKMALTTLRETAHMAPSTLREAAFKGECKATPTATTKGDQTAEREDTLDFKRSESKDTPTAQTKGDRVKLAPEELVDWSEVLVDWGDDNEYAQALAFFKRAAAAKRAAAKPPA
jgi:hypothetical protein